MGENNNERGRKHNAGAGDTAAADGFNDGRGDIKRGTGSGEPTISTDNGTRDTEQGNGRKDNVTRIFPADTSAGDTGTGTGAGTRTGAGNRPRRNNRPRRVRTGAGTGKNSSKTPLVLIEEDEKDICNMVVGIGAGVANATGYDGANVSDEEAHNFARPAARILSRHDGWAETVRTVADPIALLVAGLSIAVPRVIGYNMWKQAMMQVPPQPGLRAVPDAQRNGSVAAERVEENVSLKADTTILDNLGN